MKKNAGDASRMRSAPPSSGGDYETFSPGTFRQESTQYLKSCLRKAWKEEDYLQAERNHLFEENAYVFARLFLQPDEWNQYLWIMHHGTPRETEDSIGSAG